MTASGAHEEFRRFRAEQLPSGRSFGFLFSGCFALVGLWPIRHASPIRLWALATSVVFFLVALAIPNLLEPLNRAWMRLALLLSKVTNPVLMGLLFYAIFTPCGLLLRVFGKDLLKAKLEPKAKSYWIPRPDGEPTPQSMERQF